MLDPVHNTKRTILNVPVRDPKYPELGARQSGRDAVALLGHGADVGQQGQRPQPEMDQDGRVYFTAQKRSPKDPPDYCKQGSSLRSAQLYPLDVHARRASSRTRARSRSTIPKTK